MHISVLSNEVVAFLNPEKGDVIVDATLGEGGHAGKILDKILPGGLLVGVDQDRQMLDIAHGNLEKFGRENFRLVKANFVDLDKVLKDLGVSKIDGIVFDLGICSYHLDTAERGFSIAKDAPLDMRMDLSGTLTARDVVNRYPEAELARIIKEYGEERFSRRIAGRIAEVRRTKKIETTSELAAIVAQAVGGRKGWMRTHPATRTFQAIRIEVNMELEIIEPAIEKALEAMNPGARVCVISFHSLEDRIVKNLFKKHSFDRSLNIITKKPVTPGDEEFQNNRRSRSAKLRVAEKAG